MKYVQPKGAEANAPYVDANPAAGLDGSIVPAAAIEHPMREIVGVIEQAGMEPAAELQLYQAVKRYIDIVTADKYRLAVENGVLILEDV